MKFSSAQLFELCTPDCTSYAVSTVAEAYAFCRKVTLSHYENFPVASVLFPKKIRNHIFAVYAFARIADDISDELTDLPAEDRINALNKFEALLSAENTSNPVFIALHKTITENNLPLVPFQKLIHAFKMDVNFRQADSIDDLLNYCHYSANPVGEIVLRLFGQYNSTTSHLSDKICTALQLANFWQDLSLDLAHCRYYLPHDLLNNYSLNKESLFLDENSVKLGLFLNELFDYTQELFIEGAELIDHLRTFRLKTEIKLTLYGGMKILEKTRALGIDTIKLRPKLLFFDVISIILKTLFG